MYFTTTGYESKVAELGAFPCLASRYLVHIFVERRPEKPREDEKIEDGR